MFIGGITLLLLPKKYKKTKASVSIVTMLIVIIMVLISLGNNFIFTRSYSFIKDADFVNASQMHNTAKVLTLYTREYQQNKTKQYKDYNKMFNYKYYLSKHKLIDKQVKFANAQINDLKVDIANVDKNNKRLNYIDNKYSAYLSNDIQVEFSGIQDTINQLNNYHKAKINNNLQKEIKAELNSIK